MMPTITYAFMIGIVSPDLNSLPPLFQTVSDMRFKEVESSQLQYQFSVFQYKHPSYDVLAFRTSLHLTLSFVNKYRVSVNVIS
jgi:hypothetical protein